MDAELYTEAAEILRKAREKRATLKTLIYGSQYKNIRRLFALVNECNKHKAIIEDVLSHCCPSIVCDLAEGNADMALVLLYEYLLGHKFGRDVSMRKMVQHYKQEIATSVEKVLQKHQAKTLAQASQKMDESSLIQIPRYMRVNLIKSTVEDAVGKLISEGWDYIGKINIEEYSVKVGSLGKWQFGLDPLLFDLLVFSIGTDLHDHPLTTSGVLVQQDRASCVPAHVLNPVKGSVVLDCCSAPGNKTSHLASLMGDTGQVIALDRDSKRMSTMSRLLERSGATCVDMIVQDFLTVHPDSDDARNIRFILVDPSCSGSGMLGSRSEKFDTTSDSQRLQTLKRFQILILKHALRFPGVERVVYSTCSVHPEENEEVVEEVMMQVSEYFQFQNVLPEWTNSRGLDGFAHSHLFLRLSPENDLTQGFFVACFERVKAKQEQPICSQLHQIDGAQRCRESMKETGKIIMKNEAEIKVKSEGQKKMKKSKKKAKLEEEISSSNMIHFHNYVSKTKKKEKTESADLEAVEPDNTIKKLKSKNKTEHEENNNTETIHVLKSDRKRKKKEKKKMAAIECLPSSYEPDTNIVYLKQKQLKDEDSISNADRKNKSEDHKKFTTNNKTEHDENISSREADHVLNSERKGKKKRKSQSADIESVSSSYERNNNIVCLNLQQISNGDSISADSQCDNKVGFQKCTTKVEGESFRPKSRKSKKRKNDSEPNISDNKNVNGGIHNKEKKKKEKIGT